MTDTTAKIDVAGLTLSFGSEKVLNGIDLDVAPGGSLVLIGPSGSGKTVTLKCIVGLLRPNGGHILIDGEDVTKVRGSARDELLGRFGMLFQQAALFDSLPVWRNVGFRLLQDKSNTPAEVRETVDRTLRSVGLEPATGDLLPAELSGGMQKRVGIARAIAARPEIILLDEPTAGLDPIMSRVISDLIVTNVRELGATAISVTSDISTAVRVGDRIAMLDEGRVVWCGPADEITRTGIDQVDRFIHKWKVETQAAA